jgi:hypothetical protein
LSLSELRQFALGELGWSQDRWMHSTIGEFILAADGYWRNWERNTAWLMRELVFTMIAGNPYIKDGKPKSSREIFKIRDDENKKSLEAKRVSPEELEEVRKLLISKRDGAASKDMG